jgi:hypothetical protein
MINIKQNVQTNLTYFLYSSVNSKVWQEELDIDTFVEYLFYNNGYNFIKKWYSNR